MGRSRRRSEIKRSSRKCELLDFEIKRSGEHPAVWDLTAPLNTSWPWTSSASLLEAVGGYATHDDFIPLLALVHASQSRLPHLFLFDELFRGTGTVERIAAAEATLRELVTSDEDGQTSSQHVVIAATHDRELVELLQRTFASYHFSDTVDSDGLAFDYQLRKGAASSWNAIALLELCGAPQRIVERALARTAGLSDQRRLGQPAVDRD